MVLGETRITVAGKHPPTQADIASRTELVTKILRHHKDTHTDEDTRNKAETLLQRYGEDAREMLTMLPTHIHNRTPKQFETDQEDSLEQMFVERASQDIYPEWHWGTLTAKANEANDPLRQKLLKETEVNALHTGLRGTTTTGVQALRNTRRMRLMIWQNGDTRSLTKIMTAMERYWLENPHFQLGIVTRQPTIHGANTAQDHMDFWKPAMMETRFRRHLQGIDLIQGPVYIANLAKWGNPTDRDRYI